MPAMLNKNERKQRNGPIYPQGKRVVSESADYVVRIAIPGIKLGVQIGQSSENSGNQESEDYWSGQRFDSGAKTFVNESFITTNIEAESSAEK